MCERDAAASPGRGETRALLLSTSRSSSRRSLLVLSCLSKLWKLLACKTTGLFPVAGVKMSLLDRIFPFFCLILTAGLLCDEEQHRPAPVLLLASGRWVHTDASR